MSRLIFFRRHFQAAGRICNDLILILQSLPVSDDIIDDFLSLLNGLLIIRFLRPIKAFHLLVLFGAGDLAEQLIIDRRVQKVIKLMDPDILIHIYFAFVIPGIDLKQHLAVVFVICLFCIVDQIRNWVLADYCVYLFLAYELIVSILLLVYFYLFLL